MLNSSHNRQKEAIFPQWPFLNEIRMTVGVFEKVRRDIIL